MSSTILDRNGGTSSSSAAVDRATGLSSSAAIKGPCKTASTTNITLSGLQTVGGVVLAEGDRVLVMGQTDATLNGIRIASTGAWQRSPDFNRNDDLAHGTMVRVAGGTSVGNWVLTTADPINVGSSNLTFATDVSLNGYITAASPVFSGNPTAPTASPGDSDLSLANTAFVTTAIAVAVAALINGAPGALDTLKELADAMADDAAFATTVTNALATCLKNNTANQTVAGGARITPSDIGTLSAAGSNTITPDPGTRPIQKITNDHAGSILPGSNVGTYLLEVINTTGAGAITTTGWTLKGDSFDTTTTSKFLCSCIVTSDMKLMTITKVA